MIVAMESVWEDSGREQRVTSVLRIQTPAPVSMAAPVTKLLLIGLTSEKMFPPPPPPGGDGRKRATPKMRSSKNYGLSQTEESGAEGEQSSAASSAKRPRIGAFLHKGYSDDMDRVSGFTSSMGTARTAEDFATAMNGIIEENLRYNNGRFEEVSWVVKKVTKKDREEAHGDYQRRRLPLGLQYGQEEQCRRATEQCAPATTQKSNIRLVLIISKWTSTIWMPRDIAPGEH
ncbi:hypothetical protein LQW54_008857 [Pestalotiopsis sp. IQ-011]